MDTRSESSPNPLIAPAELAWRGDQPFSRRFEDIYHAADGAAEVHRVFLAPTGFGALCARRAAATPARRVLVGELGFGSGLNFVVAAEACLRTGCRLHFISFEAAPIGPDDFHGLARRRRAQLPLYHELDENYPPLIRGWHRRVLADGQITLSLFWGDAATGLADIADRQRTPLDIWFLDGFAPDRNPQMWEPTLLQRIASLSAPGTRVGTFTAAGRVRRGLAAAGFEMTRVDQRPHKRESLAGTLSEGVGLRSAPRPPDSVRVAGAGLAGASVARHLAEAGVDVAVADPGLNARAPQGPYLPASRIDTTVLHSRLLADGSTAAALRCHGFLYAASFLRRFNEVRRTGVLQLPDGTQQIQRLLGIADTYQTSGDWLRVVDAQMAAELTGWPIDTLGLWFPDGGLVDTPALCRALLDHPRITTAAEAVCSHPSATPLVLACGPACHQFESARYLEIAPVHGQLDLVATARLPAAPMVGNGYLAPTGSLLAAGATYEHRPWHPEQATQRNLAQLGARDYQWRRRIRGTRSVSSDRLPVAGYLYGPDALPLAGKLVSTGHGSMGTVTSHVAGAVIAAMLTGDFAPLTRDLEAAMSPLRFRERQARRGFRHGARP